MSDVYSSTADETFLLLLFFFFLPLVSLSQPKPIWACGRNKRNEEGAVGKGLDSMCGDIAE